MGGGGGGGGGGQLLIPYRIETHITCDFPGGSGHPVPPSGSALEPNTASFWWVIKVPYRKMSVSLSFADWARNSLY